jgi:hypothetical protein
MTLQEFKQRTGLNPTEQEFDYIHALYMETPMDKDAFCSEFKKYGKSQLLNDVHVVAVNHSIEVKRQARILCEIAEILIGKACAYDDTDLYRKAVELVGINRVIEMKIKLNLPLWDEDKAYLIKLLNR